MTKIVNPLYEQKKQTIDELRKEKDELKKKIIDIQQKIYQKDLMIMEIRQNMPEQYLPEPEKESKQVIDTFEYKNPEIHKLQQRIAELKRLEEQGFIRVEESNT